MRGDDRVERQREVLRRYYWTHRETVRAYYRGYSSQENKAKRVKEYGDKLRRWRKEHGLTQRKLAEKLGVTNSCVCRWELGGAPVPERVIEWAGL